MLCRYCGTDNPGVHRFCGMCGKPLDEEPDAGSGGPRKDSSASTIVPAGPVESAAERPAPAPAYTGGIFNLGAPSDSSSRSVDYLLEDDEPRSGKGLLLFGVLAVALVVGLGWMRFRQTGIPGLKGLMGSSSPSASSNAPAPNPASPDASAGAPPSTTPAGTAPAGSEQPPSPNALQTPATNEAASPQPNGNTPGSPQGTSPPSNQPPTAGTSSTASAPSGSETPANGVASQPAPSDHDQAGSKEGEQKGEGAPAAAPSASAPAPSAPRATMPPAAVDPDVATPAKPKKLPKPTPTKTEDTVALGEKYLYGRGVPQSCEKGLRYVKPAADQSNPKAMITMGALYATGHCLSRDLPTAYRYFALALRQDPGNGALKQNAEMVWGQMTQSERQLAIRLTQ